MCDRLTQELNGREWTPLVHLSQGEKRFFEKVGGALSRNRGFEAEGRESIAAGSRRWRSVIAIDSRPWALCSLEAAYSRLRFGLGCRELQCAPALDLTFSFH